jgi:SWIM zinc finger domain-containing protein
MRTIKERDILSIAPNASAVSNAKKISSGSQFVRRLRSEDDSFYMGECKGSGKSNYIVSADYIEEENPVFRCSCPSRQLPCKHSIALLYEMLNQKEFELTDIPEDILEKRKKKEAREAKKQETKETEADKPAKKKSPASKAAAKKKINKQLEGLAVLRKMVNELLLSGLSTMGSISLKSYKDLVKQLGDYYLSGAQTYFTELVLEIEKYQKDSDSIHYKNSIEVLKRLRALEKKATKYLEEKLVSDNLEIDDNTLYEDLGGILKLDDLDRMGLTKENADLVQLSFREVYNESRKEFIDVAYWIDLESGEISYSLNYRPVKALKYIKKEDSCFDILEVKKLYYYPGSLNKRIRWDTSVLKDRDAKTLEVVKSKAYNSIKEAVKAAKAELKNTLSESSYGFLINYESICELENEKGRVWVIKDREGDKLELKNPDNIDTVELIKFMDYEEVRKDGAIFGKIYYSVEDRKLYMEPCSIITDNNIISLEY